MAERKKARPVTATRFKAVKKLSFVRDGGDRVIDEGKEFAADGTMNIDQMLKSGKIEEAD